MTFDRQKVNMFLDCLWAYVSSKAQDAATDSPDSGDSCAGMQSYLAERKLEAAVYDLFDVQ
jgi:hypothetical protein